MGQGAAHGSTHDSAYSSAPVEDGDDSLFEEMSPVKAKKPSKCTSKAKKNDTKDPSKGFSHMCPGAHVKVGTSGCVSQPDCGVLESRRSGKKNNKHVEHVARKKNNTNGPFGLGSYFGFLTLVDLTGTSYAKLFTDESSRKSIKFCTLTTPARNKIDVVVLLESSRAISEMFDYTAYGFFWGNAWLLLTMLGTLGVNYAREIIKLRADVELKDTIVVAMPKLFEEELYTCTNHVNNIGLGVAKNLKNHSQAPRGVLVGPKVGFKLVKQVYRPVSKKNNANISGNKKKFAESRKEVSNPTLIDVFNSVKNDVDFGTDKGTSNMNSKEANSSGSTSWNVKSSSTSATPIVEKN
nr:hypothetical protein [Tanacetum cinerariifolium]